MEVCGFYQREEWAPKSCAGQEIGYAAGRDDRNWIRLWLAEGWRAAGLKMKDADAALGTNGMAGHYFGASQWSLPTWEAYVRLAECAALRGPARDRPYLVHPSQWPVGGLRASYDHLRAEYDHLRAEYDHLRAEYEASRPAFACPMGVGNVWRHGQVSGPERLRAADGSTLHPCQKPVLFSRRIVLASSRPGDLVCEPFAGSARIAAAVESLPPAEARRYVCVEPDEDGRDYLPAVLRDLAERGARAEGVDVQPRGQVSIFDALRPSEERGLFGAVEHNTGRP
jgi:site-specific DNA-methyltransferase (adenine-specific)